VGKMGEEFIGTNQETPAGSRRKGKLTKRWPRRQLTGEEEGALNLTVQARGKESNNSESRPGTGLFGPRSTPGSFFCLSRESDAEKKSIFMPQRGGKSAIYGGWKEGRVRLNLGSSSNSLSSRGFEVAYNTGLEAGPYSKEDFDSAEYTVCQQVTTIDDSS